MMSRRLALRLALSGGILLLALLLAEFGLWISGEIQDPGSFGFRRMTQAVTDDDQGRYAVHPERFFSTAAHHRRGAGHLGRYATGRWPFRGRLPEPRPPGMALVAVLGDSCVYGAGVDVSDSLPEQIALALAAQGFGPDQVLVANFGVPGYSTLQIRLLLDEVLLRHEPDAVVVYPAAWNDQAPALKRPDLEMQRFAQAPTFWEQLESHSRLLTAARHLIERVPGDELLASWRAGRPVHGYRVAQADTVGNVLAMQRACEQARPGGTPLLVLTAAHPELTRRTHSRTGGDARAIREALKDLHDSGRGGAVSVIDGHALLEQAGAPNDALYFVDYVHPSPVATRLLAQPVAGRLGELLGGLSGGARRGAQGDGGDRADGGARGEGVLGVLSVEPRETFTSGDVRIRVELTGWTSADPLPVVTIGGAPLLAVEADGRADGRHGIAGQLMANGPGHHAVVVQTAWGCAVLPAGLTLTQPYLAWESPAVVDAPGLMLHGHPGDVARIRRAPALLPEPDWTTRGAFWLDPDGLASLPGEYVVGPDGQVAIELPPWAGRRPLVLQAIVAPAGEPDVKGQQARWVLPFEVALR